MACAVWPLCSRRALVASSRSSSPAGAVAAKVLAADRASVDLGVPDFRPAALPFLVPAGARRLSARRRRPHRRIRRRIDGQSARRDSGRVGRYGAGRYARSRLSAPPELPAERQRRVPCRSRASGASGCASTSAAPARRSRVARARRRPLRSGVAGVSLWPDVEVSLPGGDLTVSWPGPGSPLWQTGATTAVYEGYIEL